jgi:hypothetical protein
MAPQINTADYIRPATAAKLANVSRALAYRLIAEGVVPSVEIDGTVFVHRRDVRLIVATPGMGRPRKT